MPADLVILLASVGVAGLESVFLHQVCAAVSISGDAPEKLMPFTWVPPCYTSISKLMTLLFELDHSVHDWMSPSRSSVS